MRSRIFFDHSVSLAGAGAGAGMSIGFVAEAPLARPARNKPVARLAVATPDVPEERIVDGAAATPRIDKEKLAENHIFIRGDSKQSEKAIAAYKSLRSRVLSQMAARQENSLMVMGPTQNVGKTLTAINLALAIARKNTRKVVLVDLDLRAPSLHHRFGFQPQASIVDVAHGKALLKTAMVDVGVKGLSILPGTQRYEDSSELLVSPELAQVFEELSALPDTIVVYDTPPILGCDDVLAVSEHLKTGLLVIRQGVSGKKELRDSLKMLSNRVSMLGAMINGSTELDFNAYYY